MAELDLAAFDQVEPLGSGGLGDVYRATRRSTSGEVAIKVLRDWTDRDVAWQRTQRELRALVDLRGHPNVVNVEEVIETDGAMAIVMEFAPGGSVLDLLQERGGRLELPEALLIGEQTAAALAAAHERGIIHRDIKPHNLLIGSFGQVKVCDFGIASLTRSEAVRDRTSSLSIRYASPEELRGEQVVGPAADIYSLAATLHQLLTGQYLRQPDGTAGSLPLRTWHASDDVPADVEVEFRSLVVRAADRDPEQRPSATELRDRFEQLSGRLGAARVRSLPLVAGGGATAAGAAGAAPGSDGPASTGLAAGAAAVFGAGAAAAAVPDATAAAAHGAGAAVPDATAAAAPGVGAVSAPTQANVGSGGAALGATVQGTPPGGGASSVGVAPALAAERAKQGRTALMAFVALAVLLGGAVIAFGTGLFGGGDDDASASATTIGTETVPPTEPTVAPTTEPAVVTVAPTTVAPTTVAPTTAAPTTAAPTTAAPTTVAPTTTLPERYAGAKCPGDGACIEMQSIRLVDGQYSIDWQASFAPDTGGTHAHFFWDVYEASQVGSASADRAPWELTAAQPFVPSGEMSIANRPPGATGICVTAADGSHAVIDPAFFHCALVEAGDFGGAGVVDLFDVAAGG